MSRDRWSRPGGAVWRAGWGAVCALALTGCAAVGPGSQTCVDWVMFATPADALADAELAVTARVLGRDGTETVYGQSAHAWTVSTEGLEVLSGQAPADEVLRVISTPVSCEPGPAYPDGDPLDTDAVVILFLTRDTHDGAGDGWRTLTPRQGVVPAGPGGDLPERWPPRVGG